VIKDMALHNRMNETNKNASQARSYPAWAIKPLKKTPIKSSPAVGQPLQLIMMVRAEPERVLWY
jgi:hypothetical protein